MTRPRGAEETDTRRTAQDSTTAGQKEGGIARTAAKAGGPLAQGSDAGTRVAGWSFSVREEKETSRRERTETRVASREGNPEQGNARFVSGATSKIGERLSKSTL